MSERLTPDTDAPRSGFSQTRELTSEEWFDLYEKTKRERDEARFDLEFRRGLYKVQEERLEKVMKELDEAREEIKRLRYEAQKEAEHHDRMVKELEGLYDKLKS